MKSQLLNFKEILVPFDGSSCALKAFKTALKIGNKFDSMITVIICLKSPSNISLYYNSKFDEKILKKQKTSALQKVLKLEEHAKKSGIRIKSHILQTDSIVKSIVNFAKSNHIDIIIMGARGQTKFKELLTGSVSSGVLKHSSCSVMIER